MHRSWGAPGVLALAMLVCCGCGTPEDDVATVWHDPAETPEGTEVLQARSVAPRPAPSPDQVARTPQAPPSARDGRTAGLEVVVRLDRLQIGWTGEVAEDVSAWPTVSSDSLPPLVDAARAYAQRELAAAAANPGTGFDGFARILIEPGSMPATEHLATLLASLHEAGFDTITLQVGAEPFELPLPLLPRAPTVESGAGAEYGYARLRWGADAAGVWMDGDVVFSEPMAADDAPPGRRPDYAVGLRSAWACALVEPEPDFTQAVRRATSALKTFQLPPDLPLYLELAPGAPFADAWQLARELRAHGHQRVGFVRGGPRVAPSAACPQDARNAASLRGAGPRFLRQDRAEGVRVGAALDHFGLPRAL